MKSVFYLSIILLIGSVIISCQDKGKVTNKLTSEEIMEEEKKMQSIGMKKAWVVDYSKSDAECGFLIKTEGEEVFQPVKIPEALQKDNQSVWIDFTRSRRMQGPCKLGTPITINNIETRSIKP